MGVYWQSHVYNSPPPNVIFFLSFSWPSFHFFRGGTRRWQKFDLDVLRLVRRLLLTALWTMKRPFLACGTNIADQSRTSESGLVVSKDCKNKRQGYKGTDRNLDDFLILQFMYCLLCRDYFPFERWCLSVGFNFSHLFICDVIVVIIACWCNLSTFYRLQKYYFTRHRWHFLKKIGED